MIVNLQWMACCRSITECQYKKQPNVQRRVCDDKYFAKKDVSIVTQVSRYAVIESQLTYGQEPCNELSKDNCGATMQNLN